MARSLYENPVLALPRSVKRGLVVSVDIILCVIATWLSFAIRLGEFLYFNDFLAIASAISIVLILPILAVFGVYQTIIRYSGWHSVSQVGQAALMYALIYCTVFSVFGVTGIPRTIGILQPIFVFLLVSGSRICAKMWLRNGVMKTKDFPATPQVLIYGAGKAGVTLASALKNSNEMRALGFLDDDEKLQGNSLIGLPVFDPRTLSDVIAQKSITHVLLAMPSISRARRNVILSQVADARVIVRTLPSVSDITEGRVTVSDIREPDADDLLNRCVIEPNPFLLRKKIKGKVVLVTGAGGSIGSELCRQIAELGPERLVMVESNEFSLYQITEETRRLTLLEGGAFKPQVKLEPRMGSVQDQIFIKRTIGEFLPDTIYHCAAYKHVPLVESNLIETVKNNIFGTAVMAQQAVDAGVADFVLVSSDKAVRPTNVMGATKRVSEMILQAFQNEDSVCTRFSMVRFGNVLASSGSVIPLFWKQIRDGGPITITHPEVTRFFMTIPEAAQLVLLAGSLAEGGEVFLLEMGEPIKILDLAKRMVQLSGLTVKGPRDDNGDIEIEFIGLRPGEKLYEELLIDDSSLQTTHPKILVAREQFICLATLLAKLDVMSSAAEENRPDLILNELTTLVDGFSHKPAMRIGENSTRA